MLSESTLCPAVRSELAPARSAASPAAPAGGRISDSLRLLQQHVEIGRRVVHGGDPVYRAGDRFANLHVIHSGFFKTINVAADGRVQMVGLHFKGDWLGFDGIAGGQYGCDALAMDTGEVWTMRYERLLAACASQPALLTSLHAAMSREIRRDRDSLLAMGTLPADARVADFLRYWAEAQGQCGLCTGQIMLRMTRAEIGNYLGMTLETVSRALSKLSRSKLISFREGGRREVHIPDVGALARYVEQGLVQ